METYLSIEGLAKYLGIAEKTVRKWVLNHAIPYHKIMRIIQFRVSEIEQWIETKEVQRKAVVLLIGGAKHILLFDSIRSGKITVLVMAIIFRALMYAVAAIYFAVTGLKTLFHPCCRKRLCRAWIISGKI